MIHHRQAKTQGRNCLQGDGDHRTGKGGRERRAGGGAVPEPRADRVGTGVAPDVSHHRREELLLLLRRSGGCHGWRRRSDWWAGAAADVVAFPFQIPPPPYVYTGARATDMGWAGPTGQRFTWLWGRRLAQHSKNLVSLACGPYLSSTRGPCRQSQSLRGPELQIDDADASLSLLARRRRRPASICSHPWVRGIEEGSKGSAPAMRACAAGDSRWREPSPPATHSSAESPVHLGSSPPLFPSLDTRVLRSLFRFCLLVLHRG